MQIVTVTINKGGVGKTTITKNLATVAAAAGLTVLIVDMDTQQNADAWGAAVASISPTDNCRSCNLRPSGTCPRSWSGRGWPNAILC